MDTINNTSSRKFKKFDWWRQSFSSWTREKS